MAVEIVKNSRSERRGISFGPIFFMDGLNTAKQLSSASLFQNPITSQKANSIWWIKQNLPLNSLPAIYLKPHQEITEDILERIEYPAFIRPCPINPRPGEIESDIAHHEKSLLLILDYFSCKMSKKHEEMGDIVIQPFKEAIANIVWTAGIMVIGPFYDGATRGISPSIIINTPPPDFYKKAIQDLSISSADIEMVVDSNMSVWVTQIRSASLRKFSIAPGPKGACPGFLSYSPLRVQDNRIISIGDSIEGTSALCDQMQKTEDNVIVYHPNGSPLSHIAAQCHKKNYSYVTTDVQDAEWLSEPVHGWVIKGASLDENYKVDYFPNDFFMGIETGLKPTAIADVRKAWKTSLPFYHYVHQISICKRIAYLSGIFIGNLLRITLAISMRQAWQLTRNADICPEIKANIASCYTSNGFNTYSLCAAALQIRHEEFYDCFRTLYNLFKEVEQTEVQVWQSILEITWLISFRIEEKDREEVIRLSLMLLERLRQIPWALNRILERDDIYSMLHLAIPQTWNRTAQAWSQCLLILLNQESTNRYRSKENSDSSHLKSQKRENKWKEA
jgi:hypothetical protein